EYDLVWNRTVTGAPSRPPAAVRTPEDLAGMRTLMVVSGLNAVAGVNTIVSPLATVQVPGTAGVMLGLGESAASGAENVIATGREPFTWCVASAGVTESTCSGGAGLARWAWCAFTAADADEE